MNGSGYVESRVTITPLCLCRPFGEPPDLGSGVCRFDSCRKYSMDKQERQRQYVKDHYDSNKQYYLDKNKRKKAELRAYLNEQKDKPCTDCGVKYPHYVMDFDHLPGSVKLCNPSTLANCGSLKKLKEEIAKCELVCSNCHRVRTYLRSQEK